VNCHGRGSSASRSKPHVIFALPSLHNVSTRLTVSELLTHENKRSAPVQCQYGVSLSRYMSLLIPSLAWYDIIDTIHAKLDEGGR
jgi:hypothetical protein